ncbi:MAG: HAD family hydrolase [Treponema sp.]|jgi:putative hydrolase of the HAD superfamily|nr:HAD family hydrolase [Treponema sp.]
MYRAIFFDRDETLTYNDQSDINIRDQKIKEWSGHPFVLTYEKFIDTFKRTKMLRESFKNIKSLEEEKIFFSEFIKLLLINEGITEKIDEKAKILTKNLWFFERKLFPETMGVLEYFNKNGYEMGVISDTDITLEETLKNVGIAKYFKSFTSSAEVGVSKPDPRIFNAALDKHNVKADECIYIDDYDAAVNSARELGFTSFLINRDLKNKEKWKIKNLKEIIEYVEKGKW